MLRIILGIFVIFLSCGILEIKNDKATDEPAMPIGDILNKNMKNICGHYKANIDDDIVNLKDFGHISAMTGMYVFNICKNCRGPMIGHEKTEAECKEKEMDYKLSGKLQDEVLKHDLFECFKAGIDTRTKEIECNECGNKFLNRLQRENHDRLMHNGKNTEKKAIEMDEMAKIIASTSAGMMKDVLTDIGDILKDNKEMKVVTTQITKAKPPPIWIGGDYERFRDEVEAWDENNADSEMTKYANLIESLKRNKDIKENYINVIQDKAREIGEKSVKKVLEEKYRKTTIEKAKDILREILGFEMKSEENFEEYWNRCEVLITKCKRENIKEKFYYMIAAMIVDKAEKNGKLTEEEKRRLNEAIETEEDSNRVPKNEETRLN